MRYLLGYLCNRCRSPILPRRQRRLAIVLHYKLLAEYRAVLARLAQQGQLRFTLPQIDRFLAAIVTVAEEIEVRYLRRPNLPDESGNFVYDRDFESPELRWSGVLIQTPRQILKEFKEAAGGA